MRQRLWWLLLSLVPLTAQAVPSLVEPVTEGVWVVRDDEGNWGGMTNGITHQNKSPYQAKKILDFSDVPAEIWPQLQEVRLSLYFMVHDYSWHDLPEVNGLDEAYEIVVNGTVHHYPTNSGAPVFPARSAPTMAWYDLVIPKEEWRRGVNEVIVRKAPGEKSDDYLYLGIDNGIRRGNSEVTFEGDVWTKDKLTIPGGNGEYMVRAYLIARPTEVALRWQPGSGQLDDPTGLIRFAGLRRP
ncbi:MAG: hypothetical protein HUU35_18065, partial [Armatimonadetes bacterium]|nr:hypothetical protein [Armatimonadota bacterium]